MDNGGVSIREYARRIGVSEGLIRKAIKEGMLPTGYNQGTKKIRPEEATAEWGYKYETQRVRPGKGRVNYTEKPHAIDPPPSTKPKNPTPAPEPVSSASALPMSTPGALDLLQSIVVTTALPVAEAVRLREIIGAQQDKLKLAEAEGKLVSKEKVYKALYSVANELKKALLNIPTRVVRDIMAADNEVMGINILTDEINATLATFGNLNSNSL